jgi:hypothetical protein
MDSDLIPISHYEVTAAIAKLNNKKSGDEFVISAEHFKLAGQSIVAGVIVWTHIAYFTEKVATIGHYNLVSIPHFCRNSLFWTILVKICSLRCAANCSVLYGELPKITFVLYGSLLGRLEYKVQKSMKLSKYRINWSLLSVMKQLLVFLSNISSQVNESSCNFIRSDLIRVSCVVVS